MFTVASRCSFMYLIWHGMGPPKIRESTKVSVWLMSLPDCWTSSQFCWPSFLLQFSSGCHSTLKSSCSSLFFFKSLFSSMSSITNWKSSRFRMCSYLPNNNLELHAVWWYSWSLQGYGSMKMVSRNTLTVIRKLYLPGST